VKPALLLSILFCAAVPAGAQELSAPSTPHVADPDAEPPPELAPAPLPVCAAVCPPGQTHEGFYLRLQTGVGYIKARHGVATFSGNGFTLGGAIGFTPVANLAVFGTMLFHEVRNPDTNMYGLMTTYSGALATESFGAGLAYYLVPANVYAAAAAVWTSAEVHDGGNNKLWTSNRGLGFDLMLGKEWWVGRDWGLGFAAEITGAWMTDTDFHETTWSSFTYSLLFSATYN